jgi:hypothetical protein
VNGALGLAAGAEAFEPALAPAIKRTFGHDSPSRISSAQEQHVEYSRCHQWIALSSARSARAACRPGRASERLGRDERAGSAQLRVAAAAVFRQVGE